VGELRYAFADGNVHYDGAVGNVSRSPDGRFLINNDNGKVYVNGAQPLDYESGQTAFSYATRLTDRANNSHALAQAERSTSISSTSTSRTRSPTTRSP
jgi:hypothetical protein